MSTINRAVAEATRAVNQAIRDSYATQAFEIVRFGRHRDGYLHAQVTINGAPVYVHLKYGSWLIPREPQSDTCPVAFGDRAVFKEVLAPYTFALGEAARKFRDHEHKQEAHNAASEADNDRRDASGPEGGGPAAQAA